MAEALYNGAAVMLATGDALAASRAQSRRMADGAVALRAANVSLADSRAANRSATVARDEALDRLAAARSRLAAVRARHA